jgi:hypothetical protein
MHDKRKNFVKRTRKYHHGKSVKTRLKLNPNLDYTDMSFGAPKNKRDYSGSWFIMPHDSWLKSHIGKKWDDVYSEICSLVDRRTFAAKDIKRWINWQVDFSTKIDVFGKIVAQSKGGWSPYHYYVHPTTNILCSWDSERLNWICPENTEKCIDFIPISETEECELIDNIWYKFIYKLNDPNELIPQYGYSKEGIYQIISYKKAEDRYFFKTKTLVIKRQMGKKAIRKMKKDYLHLGLNKAHIERTGKKIPVCNFI